MSVDRRRALAELIADQDSEQSTEATTGAPPPPKRATGSAEASTGRTPL